MMNTPLSFPSTKSVKTIFDLDEDYELIMVELCKRFRSPIPIAVIKEYARDTKSRTREFKRHASNKIPSLKLAGSSATSSENVTTESAPDMTITVTAVFDAQYHLSEVLIENYKDMIIPRVTMQLLTLTLPYYTQLYRFTLKNCCIDKFTVYELSKVLPLSTITDLSLDGCPVKEGNYALLLKNTTCLHNLSLCRCEINDAVCKEIALNLHFMESAENTLITLNLTSNTIGDKGASYFADALRSNRRLRYLNLADNDITDDGAGLIFNILMEFSLSCDENARRRERHMVYLRKANEIYFEYLHKLSLFEKPSFDSLISDGTRQYSVPSLKTRKSATKLAKKETSDISMSQDKKYTKAELKAKELAGPFVDPFCLSNITVKDGYANCIGNFVLCYLNIAYNNLSYLSVKTLLSAVQHQEIHCKPGTGGLMKVILDGNNLPVSCTELLMIQKALDRHIVSHQRKVIDTKPAAAVKITTSNK